MEDTDLERKTTTAAAGPASFEPNASLKRSPAPVEDTSLERRTPAAAGGPTSADSNAFVKQHRSGMKHSRNHDISTSASAKHQKSKEGGGATSSKKSKNSKHLQKDTADLSAKDERELAEPYSPPIVMSLAASPEKALDPSNLSAATVELPGTCSPLRTHPTPAAAHPHPPGCQVNQLLGKRKARQGSSCPYFWPWPL
ncbi:uncharacterized protein LOC142765308 isoform X4 [Rhipicephalus microplus]|uniref:uncharacterized protein LOC142765308 isoform X4 n=1 Tax=Rhipicephalus microplus TaxID=6941 RepID=UPI003F6AC036